MEIPASSPLSIPPANNQARPDASSPPAESCSQGPQTTFASTLQSAQAAANPGAGAQLTQTQAQVARSVLNGPQNITQP